MTSSTSRPVSSFASRRQALPISSPQSTNPPGSAQPRGSFLRRISTMRPSGPAMIASVVAAGSSAPPRSRGHQSGGRRLRRRRFGLEASVERMGEQGAAEGVGGVRPERSRDGERRPGGVEATFAREHVRHLHQALGVKRAALRREVRERGVVGGPFQCLPALRRIDVEPAGGDLVEAQREPAQVVLLRNPRHEERILEQRGARQLMRQLVGQLQGKTRRRRRRLRRGPEQAQRIGVGRWRRESVAGPGGLRLGDQLPRMVLRDLDGGDHVLPRKPLDELPPGPARKLIAEAEAAGARNGFSPPPAYADALRLLGPAPQTPPPSPGLSLELPDELAHQLAGAALFEDPLFMAWIPEEDDLRRFALRLDEIATSQLYIDAAQRRQALERAADDAALAYFTPQRRALYAKRLVEMAHVLASERRLDAARTALAVSRALGTDATNSFCRALFTHSLQGRLEPKAPPPQPSPSGLVTL